MNIEKVEQILDIIRFVSKEETQILLYKLNSILFNNIINSCINCGLIKFHKNDKRKQQQRYKCYDCKKFSSSTLINNKKSTNSITGLIEMDEFYFRKYIIKVNLIMVLLKEQQLMDIFHILKRVSDYLNITYV